MYHIKPSQITVTDADIADLTVDPDAQRDLDMKRATLIGDNWDAGLAGVITVAVDEDGTAYIGDGQHRVVGARIAGITHLRCMVVTGLDKQQRAQFFLDLNKKRKPLDLFTDWRVSANAGSPLETQIDAMLATRGLRVAAGQSAHHIQGVSAIRKLWDAGERTDSGGLALVTATVDAILATWGSTEGGARWQADLISAIGRCIHLNPTIDLARLPRVLARRGPRVWVADGQVAARGPGGSGRPTNIAHIIAAEFNKGLRNPDHRMTLG